MPTIAYAILALLILAKFAHDWIAQQRCLYCGVIAGHEDSCPYNLDREERP